MLLSLLVWKIRSGRAPWPLSDTVAPFYIEWWNVHSTLICHDYAGETSLEHVKHFSRSGPGPKPSGWRESSIPDVTYSYVISGLEIAKPMPSASVEMKNLSVIFKDNLWLWLPNWIPSYLTIRRITNLCLYFGTLVTRRKEAELILEAGNS